MILLATTFLWPLFSALICLVFTDAKNKIWWNTLAALVYIGLAGFLLALPEIKIAVGGWQFGIYIVGDLLGKIMVLINAVIWFSATLFWNRFPPSSSKAIAFLPFLIFGVGGAFLTGDIFNLYVWFEVLLMSSFVLLLLPANRARIESTLVYMILNLLGSTLFLIGVAFLYRAYGTLNFLQLLEVSKSTPLTPAAITGIILSLVAFLSKAAAFPFFAWLPASYNRPEPWVSAVFSALLTKVGVYAALRLLLYIYIPNSSVLQTTLIAVAGATMLGGVIAAAAQTDVRQILSYHIISQVGYMLMGLAFRTTIGDAACVFYLIHHIVVKAGLFFVAGILENATGETSVKKMGGMAKHSKPLAIGFAVLALSLAGIPPLSGFWAKVFIIEAGIQSQEYFLVGIAMLVSLLTLYSMQKIWSEVFWKPAVDEDELANVKISKRSLAPVFLLGAWTITLGIFVNYGFNIALNAVMVKP